MKSIYDFPKIQPIKILTLSIKKKLDRTEDGCLQMNTNSKCKAQKMLRTTGTQQQSTPEGEGMLRLGCCAKLHFILWCSECFYCSALLYLTPTVGFSIACAYFLAHCKIWHT